MKLFVGNLSWDATPADLEALFGEIGAVASANIITDRGERALSRVRLY